MARRYSISFENVACSAVQDLLAAYCGSTKIIQLVSLSIGQVTSTTAQMARFRVQRVPATVTAGSSGSTPTPRPYVDTDTAATTTAHANDTTQATSSGTIVTLLSDTFNTAVGYLHQWAEGRGPVIGLSQACVVSLDTALSPALNLSGTLVFDELN